MTYSTISYSPKDFDKSGFPEAPVGFFWRIDFYIDTLYKNGPEHTVWFVRICKKRMIWPFYKVLVSRKVESPRIKTIFTPTRGELTTTALRILQNHPRVFSQFNRVTQKQFSSFRKIEGNYPSKTLDSIFDRSETKKVS